MQLVQQHALIIPVTARVSGIATHPQDDVILATAESAQAHYLVTGERKLQRLGAYKDVKILSPSAFLVLRNEEERAA